MKNKSPMTICPEKPEREGAVEFCPDCADGYCGSGIKNGQLMPCETCRGLGQIETKETQ
jgi:DnaJ-class molecular chaperone